MECVKRYHVIFFIVIFIFMTVLLLNTTLGLNAETDAEA